MPIIAHLQVAATRRVAQDSEKDTPAAVASHREAPASAEAAARSHQVDHQDLEEVC